MLWLKITPTYQITKDDDVWEEKYSSDTSARRKITVWVDNQRIRSDATKLHAQNEFISVLLNYTCCEFLLLNVVVAHNGVEDIIK